MMTSPSTSRRTGPLKFMNKPKLMIKPKQLINYPMSNTYGADYVREHLFEFGFVVINPDFSSCREQILQDASQFPEFKIPNPHTYVCGAFGALANPSSFHCPSVRKMRIKAHKAVCSFLQSWAHDNGYKLEQVFDRLAIRPKGTSIASESWHRDMSQCASVLTNDIIFGGWWNQDETPNHFVCVPRSHKNVQRKSGEGFAKLSKQDAEHFKKSSVQVTIPPGHIILFNEMIVHCIKRVVKSPTMHVRLFLGFRLTRSDQSICGNDELIRRIKEQAPMQIKSGQEPPMFPRLYLCNHTKKLTLFANDLVQSMVTEHTFGPKSKHAGEVIIIPHRFAKSLVHQNLPLYHQYNQEEINMFIPH